MSSHNIQEIKDRVDKEVEIYKQVVKELSEEQIEKLGGFDALLERVKTNIMDSLSWSFKKENA
jgi:cytochrome c553